MEMPNGVKTAFAKLLMVIATGIILYLDTRIFSLQAIAVVMMSFVCIWPQNKSEPGIWMLGLLIMTITAFKGFTGFVTLQFSEANPALCERLESPVAVGVAIAALMVSFVFTGYASVENYRATRQSVIHNDAPNTGKS